MNATTFEALKEVILKKKKFLIFDKKKYIYLNSFKKFY
jgi:V-type H+-transporting ATPase subunit d